VEENYIKSFITQEGYEIDCTGFIESDSLFDLKLLLFYDKNMEQRKKVIVTLTKNYKENQPLYIYNNNCTYNAKEKYEVKYELDDKSKKEIKDEKTIIIEIKDDNICLIKNELGDEFNNINYNCKSVSALKPNDPEIELWNKNLINTLLDIRINSKADKKQYKDGLFKIYYNALINSFEHYSKCADKYKKVGKVSALFSYKAIKEHLEEMNLIKNKYYISPPNVFIEGSNVEFDFLILNVATKDENGKERFTYTPDEVICIGEIKTAGIFFKKELLVCKDKKLEEYNQGKKST